MKLSQAEKNWLRAAVDAVVPGDERIPVAASEAGAVEVLDDMITYLPGGTAIGLRAVVALVEFGGPLIGLRRLSRFSSLGREDREQCIDRIGTGGFALGRQAYLLIKMVACLGWGADPRVRAGLGYDRPPKFVKREASS